MQRNLLIISAIIVSGIFILCSVWLLSGETKPVINAGLSQIPPREISPFISFEEVKQKFRDYHGINRSAEKIPVYYLLSRDVDGSGDAGSWLFGVRQNNGTQLLVYDRTGWKINPWNATLPSEEIVMDAVVSPGTLFTRNKEIIFNASSSVADYRDLLLKQGKYTLTIHSGSKTRTLIFNATTGVLITGNV
ncbi:MAG: hypothetical protein WC586_07725 [Methanoregula sp.]